jgi:teichuronic acid biosynthesis glycosyltransferase TuaH
MDLSTSRKAHDGERTRAVALAVVDAGWFSTENLFREVEREDVATLLLKCMDVRNALQRRLPPWVWGRWLERSGPARWERTLVLPSGWMKTYPRLGMRPIGWTIRRWRRLLADPGRLALVMTYPYYLYLRDQVGPDRTLYYNLDDYSLFWPRRADEIRELERRAVRESDVTVCVARVRAEALRREVPEAAERIHHVPHGAPTASLAEHPWDRPAPPPADLAGLPRPWLGYVGSLEHRVDWPLLTRLAAAFPGGSVVLVGRPGPRCRASWQAELDRCLARPNVHAIGWRPQESIASYHRAFDVCLIPYRVDHPFNLVCCPTKIMDCMATTRPVVATALPECLLYADLFHVASDADEFVAMVRSVVDASSDDGLAGRRLDFARAHTCRAVAGRLLDLLGV